MILVDVEQAPISEVLNEATLLVSASGYETRARAFARIAARRIPRRVAICFEEQRDILERRNNDMVFRDYGYEMIDSPGSSPALIERLVQEALGAAGNRRASIAIDISSMTRTWYGAVVRICMACMSVEDLKTYFIYVPGKFQPPPLEAPPNEIVRPVEGFASLALPSLPAALVVGLGYEPERALGLQELLDPKLTVLMVPKFGLGDPFFKHVKRSNADILSRIPEQWIFVYPLDQPRASFRIMESVCSGLEPEFRIVLASLGPKLFGIACFLLAAKNPRISVWRVSSGSFHPARDILPDSGRAIALKAIWKGGPTHVV